MSHLILYDASCPLCNYFVQFLLDHDSSQMFLFAPLKGKTAQSFTHLFPFPLEQDSVVLIENYQTNKQAFYLKSQAIFRVFWNLGGFWKLFGWKFILPSWMTNWVYHLISKRRYQIFKKRNTPQDYSAFKDRFLP